MVILSAQGISFAYPGEDSDVLRSASLTVASGDVLCVLGPNGAGKSTLLRVLAGLLKPSSGEVSIGSQPLRSLKPKARAREIALVPQALAALPEITARDFVRQGRYARLGRFGRATPADHEAVERALREADLETMGERPLEALSGGQRQRALVARALAQEPRVVLVDEPTNSLDPRHQIQVFEVIAGLGCEGRAAVIVTHDLNLASQFATRIALMDEGRIVAEGSVHDVLNEATLRPVYGEDLVFGSRFVAGWNEERPYVLSWRSRGGS